MSKKGRPKDMSDIEWLVALEEIRQLKARRDRYVDAGDLEAYEALHAPDHQSHHAHTTTDHSAVQWNSAAEMIEGLRKIKSERGDSRSCHHSYDAEIIFDTRTKARGVWAMTAGGVHRKEDGSEGWGITFGYYYETYERRDGEWVFTQRRWHRYFAMGSDGVVFPTQPVKGPDAFVQE